MATLVAFHAHPDDESISMGGTLARAAADGHRVIVVTATDGAVGEVPEGFLHPGTSLEAVRAAELQKAAGVLGIEGAIQLGYRDSGMMGTADNNHPDCFWRADIGEAAARLAEILRREGADVLTVYDPNGGYGHPDHIQVHRVGHAAARLAGVPRVYEVSLNRDRMRQLIARSPEGDAPRADDDRYDMDRIGLAETEITAAVAVDGYLPVKRAAMAAHASQITEDSWFLKLTPELFELSFGTEWFRRITPEFTGDPAADRETWILDGLSPEDGKGGHKRAVDPRPGSHASSDTEVT